MSEFKLPEIYKSCAHPQSVWFEIHWRPIFEKQAAKIAELEKQLMLRGVSAAHYKGERDIHFKESETFVKEATDKIAELTAKVKELEDQNQNLKDDLAGNFCGYCERTIFDKPEIEKELEAKLAKAKQEILTVIDKSGNEEIYNWGAPLREIRKVLEKIQ